VAYKPLEIKLDFRTQRFQDAEMGLRALADDFDKKWDGMPKLLAEDLKGFLTAVAESLAQRHSGAWPGGTSPAGTEPGTLSKRSGTMLQSVLDSVKVVGLRWDDLQGEIGGNFYARVHEYGATIKVKNAKWLTIPLPAACDSRGVPLKKKAKDWDKTFIKRSKAGNLIIFQKRGRQLVPLYVLKEEVVIPPRLGMKAALDVSIPYFVDRSVDRMVKALAVQE